MCECTITEENKRQSYFKDLKQTKKTSELGRGERSVGFMLKYVSATQQGDVKNEPL